MTQPKSKRVRKMRPFKGWVVVRKSGTGAIRIIFATKDDAQILAKYRGYEAVRVLITPIPTRRRK